MKLKFPFRNTEIHRSEKLDLDIYSPQLQTAEEATSLDVINGCLDHQNLDFPSESSTLPLSGFRNGSLFRGRMVSTTLNSDYGKQLFDWEKAPPDHWTAGGEGWEKLEDDPDLIQPIPGAGIELYVPSSGLLLLTWQISYTSDQDVTNLFFQDNDKKEWPDNHKGHDPPPPPGLRAETKAVHSQRSFITLMGAKGESNYELSELGYRHYLPAAVNYFPDEGEPFSRQMGAGRTWSGHLINNIDEPEWYRYGLGIMSTANLARVRIRNFKYLFFPNATANINLPGTDFAGGSGLW